MRKLLWVRIVGLCRGGFGRDLLRIRIVRLGRRGIGGVRATFLVLYTRRCVGLRLNHRDTGVDGTGSAGNRFLDRSSPDAPATNGVDDCVQEDDVVVYERWGHNVSTSTMTVRRTVPQKKFKKANASTTVNS